MVRRVADYAASHAMTFCLETGQEPAAQLLAFFEDVARPEREDQLRPRKHDSLRFGRTD